MRIKFPSTEALKDDQTLSDGQQASPGKHRHELSVPNDKTTPKRIDMVSKTLMLALASGAGLLSDDFMCMKSMEAGRGEDQEPPCGDQVGVESGDQAIF